MINKSSLLIGAVFLFCILLVFQIGMITGDMKREEDERRIKQTVAGKSRDSAALDTIGLHLPTVKRQVEVKVTELEESSPLLQRPDTKTVGVNASNGRLGKHRTTRSPPRRMSVKKGGRDGPDDSHKGLFEDPTDYMYHAWNMSDPARCHGTAPRADCVDPEAVEWFRRHVLMSVISGREGAFRVEVSQCSWLSHFPAENVFIFSDRVAAEGMDRTPHTWVEGTLPDGVWEKDGDLFSKFIPQGYVHKVRAAGQGYSAGWIEAQFRFVQSLHHMFAIDDMHRNGTQGEVEGDKNAAARAANSKHIDYKWFMIIDDDTIVNINHLVQRLRQIANPDIPWYLSRKGWGGAGHAYNRLAASRLRAALPACVESFMLKSFHASDAMLLKCAGVAKLASQKEQTMSHCPASNLGPKGMLSKTQATFHGKKDFYPPVLLTSWRVYLYYVASYCSDARAADLAADWSACAFGSCKQSGCTKEKAEVMKGKWLSLTNDGTAEKVPLHLLTGGG